MLTPTTINRPARWDSPLGDGMHDAIVDRLLSIEPFRSIDPALFPASLPLRGILQNDCRVVEFESGDLVVREGDYGNSAFLVLHGHVRVALEALASDLVGAPPARKPSWWTAFASLWHDRQTPERRARIAGGPAPQIRQNKQGNCIFLQDVPRVLDGTRTARLGPGELFGELAALTRSPRSATVFADGGCVLLELRWQGLRDLMRRTPAIRQHVDRLYRDNSLRVHLRETSLLANVPAGALEHVAVATEFRSYGNFDWYRDSPSPLHPSELVEREPLIVGEGTTPEGLLLIRSGFVRVSERHGEGHRTVTYLGKGDSFGLPELVSQNPDGRPACYRYSLRAIGYADVLLVPRDIFAAEVVPYLPVDQVKQLQYAIAEQSVRSTNNTMVDYLVDSRLVNGSEAMVIDMNRCTRCDDCVRACAATHDGNPRFVRSGPMHDRFMFAHACMHCVDPVCLIGCPTGAIHRDHESGVVRINDPTCIGCATCANSCPYSNIQMVEIRDTLGLPVIDSDGRLPIVKATKCDLCSEQPAGPACQRACPHDALVRLDLSNWATTAGWIER
jgi:Fe-S-cluster-containing dehydrogenase component/CRP-like cAMP-binding protein